MAKNDAVWGIDVGQCALKAIRCRLGQDGQRLTAEAFDFIEYPKILSQPDADPVELVREAITQFLSRNSVKGDRVAISVSGQNGLARFIKLPPVEAKKIPDIVKFEARQQIPFALEDVVWDYQQMAGGSEEEGYALETEVGLFAMKRDIVFRALRPFTDAGIEVDFVQLTPIALYNYIVFDQMQNLPPPDKFDADDPPESVVVMSLGTDTTDLVVTNGYRVWQRSIPIGGNHFTKAITKELKVTFTKAEHLKRTALRTDEAKAIFQAMKPVFSDLVTEVQRSISFFGSLNKSAKIGRIVALGNTMKLRGLQKYLQQNLGIEVQEVESFKHLGGPSVVGSAGFKENVLGFGVCYGLAIQGLGAGSLSTNLLPEEILRDRMWREKRPWALAAVASLVVGCGVGFMGHWNSWSAARPTDEYVKAFKALDDVSSESSRLQTEIDNAKKDYEKVIETGGRLANIAERRVLWLELLKVINECMPSDPRGKPKPTDLSQRNELHIDSIDCEYQPKLDEWWTDVKEKRPKTGAPTASTGGVSADAAAASPDAAAPAAAGTDTAPAAGTGATPDAGATPPAAGAEVATAGTGDAPAGEAGAPGEASGGEAGPTGEGWVIQIRGFHYHNKTRGNEGAQFVRNTLLKNLEEKVIELPIPGGGTERISVKDLGISYPTLTSTRGPQAVTIEEPGSTAADAQSGEVVKTTQIDQLDFTIQFCWMETPRSKRLEAAAKRKQEAKQASDSVAATSTSEKQP